MSAAASVVLERPVDRAGELAGKPGVVRFLEVAPVRAVMVDGDGQPGEATFGARMPGLYTTAYSLRFALKRRGVERRVGMLEGLYWTSDGASDLDVERPTIERLHAAIGAAGLRPRGRHHELYLGDPRRSAPARLRTLIRQPVEPA